MAKEGFVRQVTSESSPRRDEEVRHGDARKEVPTEVTACAKAPGQEPGVCRERPEGWRRGTREVGTREVGTREAKGQLWTWLSLLLGWDLGHFEAF